MLWGNIYRFDTLSIGFPLAEHKTLAILRLNGLVGNATDYHHTTDSAAKSYVHFGRQLQISESRVSVLRRGVQPE